ncbi:MAG: hypothetical protein WC498_00285 [Candidatus Saccharimonadales bacterium]
MSSEAGRFIQADQREALVAQGPITIKDRGLLEAMGCAWPNPDSEQLWLTDINQLVTEGSRRLKEQGSDDDARSNILGARAAFVELMGAVSETTNRAVRDDNSLPAPLDTLVGTLRVLYSRGIDVPKAVNQNPAILGLGPESIGAKLDNLADHGIDAASVINKFPNTLNYPPESILARLNNLSAQGIDAIKVVKANPSILGMAPESLAAKLDNLTVHGIGAVAAVNGNPDIFKLAPESVGARLNNLTAHGINVAVAVNKSPSILRYAPKSVDQKINILYSAARAWGVENYKIAANDLIEAWPIILGYKPDRIRTVIRIISHSLPADIEPGEFTKHIKTIVINKPEATLAGYLNEPDKIRDMADLWRLGNKYKKLGGKALAGIITAHPDDPAVKIYRRGYPLPKDD